MPKKVREIITGTLEIHPERGVIYFHSDKGYTAMRIGNLPMPIPRIETEGDMPRMLDIILLEAKVDWPGKPLVDYSPGGARREELEHYELPPMKKE